MEDNDSRGTEGIEKEEMHGMEGLGERMFHEEDLSLMSSGILLPVTVQALCLAKDHGGSRSQGECPEICDKFSSLIELIAWPQLGSFGGRPRIRCRRGGQSGRLCGPTKGRHGDIFCHRGGSLHPVAPGIGRGLDPRKLPPPPPFSRSRKRGSEGCGGIDVTSMALGNL